MKFFYATTVFLILSFVLSPSVIEGPETSSSPFSLFIPFLVPSPVLSPVPSPVPPSAVSSVQSSVSSIASPIASPIASSSAAIPSVPISPSNFCLLCALSDKKAVLSFESKSLSLGEVKDYFRLRIKDIKAPEEEPKELRENIINELFFKLLLESWAEREGISLKKITLSQEEGDQIDRKSIPSSSFLKQKGLLGLYQKLLSELEEKIPEPNETQIKAFYKAHKSFFVEPASCQLKQISLRKRGLAFALRKRLKRGESFDQLAKTYDISQKTTSSKKFKRTGHPLIEQACRQAEGEIGPLLKSAYGWHIFRLEKKTSPRQKSLQEVRKDIIRKLKAPLLEKQFQVWLKKEISGKRAFKDKKLLDKIHIQYKSQRI